MAFTVSDAAAACGGISYGPEAEAARAWRCDSREVRAGDGFAAIRGAKTDGHLYIKQAAEQGARVVLAEREGLEGAGIRPEDFPGVSFIVTERRTEEALALAARNVAGNGLADRVVCVRGDGAACLAPGSCDLIVSNPPYIPTAEWAALPSLIRDHEPRLALDGGPDGLRVVAQIVLDATQALRPGGWLFLEIGENQGLSTRRLMERAGFGEVRVLPDLAGLDRYAEGRLA